MSAVSRMPVSTRLWSAAVVAAAAFCGWALLWPAPAQDGVDAGAGTLPVYPQVSAPPMQAPNPADAAWARPLFFNDRNPRVASVGDESGISGDSANGFMATLTGIVRSPGLELATLSPGQGGGKPLRVRLGNEVETQPGWRLVALGPRTATFRNGEQEQVLKLEARNALNAPPPAAAPMQGSEPRAPAPPPATPGITGQAGAAAPVPPNPATDAAETPEQRQQVEAIRQRIQARRRQMSQPAPPSPSPRPPH